jgi:hypothetical protein
LRSSGSEPSGLDPHDGSNQQSRPREARCKRYPGLAHRMRRGRAADEPASSLRPRSFSSAVGVAAAARKGAGAAA